MRLRSARLALYAVVAQLAAPYSALVAQDGAARSAAWITYSGDHPVTPRLAVLLEAQTRFLDVPDDPAQLLTRAGLTYSLGARVRLAGGYGYVSNRADGAGTSIRVPEHRLWQTAQLSHRAGGATVAHRIRAEQRRIQLAAEAADGAPLHGAWVTSHRLRYQLRGTLPIAPTGGRVYATVADELFASFGGASGGLGLDQNRAALGLGFRASRALRVEAAYLNQSTITGGTHLTVRTHVLQLSALSTAPLFSNRQ